MKPEELRVLSGESELTTYAFNTKTNQHQFCKHCGVKTFGRGDIPEVGGKYASINLATLDDLEPAELLAAPLQYFDGRNNAWQEKPAETRHL